jgi:N-acetylglucosamine transport system substrate-binding protein
MLVMWTLAMPVLSGHTDSDIADREGIRCIYAVLQTTKRGVKMVRHFGNGELDRRAFIQRTMLATMAVGGSSALASCATAADDGGSGDTPETPKSPQPSEPVSGDNPLGVASDAPLDVVIMDGGWSHEYVQEQEKIYQATYPDAEITHSATQEITSVLQPRFVNGNPPDLVNNSGGQSMDAATLAQNGQLAELTPLLDAPSWDIDGMTVGETLIDGATTANSFTIDGNDGRYGIDYVLNVPGLWYDARLFADNSWEYPSTWSDLLALGEEAAGAGTPLLAYQGQYPSYVSSIIFQPMLQKHGGKEVALAIDNLEDGAWESDAVREVLEALHELKVRELVLPGTAALDHIDSQAAWLRHEALLVPCGSWLPNEMRDQTPTEFEMSVAPIPSLGDSDAFAFEAVPYAAATPFLIPADAANVAGGMEMLRIMLSVEGARIFAGMNSALTIVQGAHEGQEMGPVVDSAARVLAKATELERLDRYRYADWYDALAEDVDQAMGQLLTGDLDPAGFVERVQAKADEIKNDDTIEKFSR